MSDRTDKNTSRVLGILGLMVGYASLRIDDLEHFRAKTLSLKRNAWNLDSIFGWIITALGAITIIESILPAKKQQDALVQLDEIPGSAINQIDGKSLELPQMKHVERLNRQVEAERVNIILPR